MVQTHFRHSFIYPESKSFKWVLAGVSSLFIYFFLIFFQPFGVNNYESNDAISWDLALGLTAIIPVIFVTISFNEFILRPKVLSTQKLTALIPWFMYCFISVGTSSFMLYNYLGDFHDFHFSSYLKHLFEISTVLIFPFFGTLFFYNYAEVTKSYVAKSAVADGMAALNEVILLKGDYKADQIALRQHAIICLESEDNYVGITFLENDQVKKHLIRSTISKMNELIDHELFVQCNRSMICNLFHLEWIKKHAPGLLLKLHYLENPVKVSKTNSPKVTLLLEKHFDLSSI
ncbi:MAG: LytTR family DNA-binding domain-containing protein [Lutimonas sp.]